MAAGELGKWNAESLGERGRGSVRHLAARVDAGDRYQLWETIGRRPVDLRGRARTIDSLPTDPVALARNVVDEIDAIASSKSVDLVLLGTGPIEAAVDGPTLQRAIADLVDNAVKHAPAGSAVEIEVDRSATEITVSVTEQGPGIPAAAQERVFERFWRGDLAPGTGLGLPIARQIAQAYGGEVTLASPGPADDGFRFRLSLPAAAPVRPPRRPA